MENPRWSSQLIDPSDQGALALWLADAISRFHDLEEENARLRTELDEIKTAAYWEVDYNGFSRTIWKVPGK